MLGDLAETFGRRFRRPGLAVDVAALQAENQVLKQQLGAAQSELANLWSNYNELSAWSTEAAAVLRKAGLIKT